MSRRVPSLGYPEGHEEKGMRRRDYERCVETIIGSGDRRMQGRSGEGKFRNENKGVTIVRKVKRNDCEWEKETVYEKVGCN